MKGPTAAGPSAWPGVCLLIFIRDPAGRGTRPTSQRSRPTAAPPVDYQVSSRGAGRGGFVPRPGKGRCRW